MLNGNVLFCNVKVKNIPDADHLLNLIDFFATKPTSSNNIIKIYKSQGLFFIVEKTLWLVRCKIKSIHLELVAYIQIRQKLWLFETRLECQADWL